MASRLLRPEFSKATMRRASARACGKCEECGQELFAGNIEFHHIVEAFMGGEATLENCLVLCRGCHRVATLARRPVIDKTRRQSDKNAGIRTRKSRPMDGSRDSRFRKRMDGYVERRELR